jgi:hypothetical protein
MGVSQRVSSDQNTRKITVWNVVLKMPVFPVWKNFLRELDFRCFFQQDIFSMIRERGT